MIDTALLIVGALMASRYFDADTPAEAELRSIADLLYRRIDWCWSQNGGETIMQGWKPECGFLHYGWEGYSEAIVLRSEEHTSELQSLMRISYAVFCLKKKKKAQRAKERPHTQTT